MPGYTWINSATGRSLPPNAVVGGRDIDGSKMYVGRAHLQGDQIPCKIIPQRREAYVSHNCKEFKVTNYEVLCEQKLHWVRNSGGSIPSGAIMAGRTSSGECLYVGKVRHGAAETVGKVHPSHGCLYIPYGGAELSFKTYEILVLK